ncbi:hypothetical protein GWD52_21250 [Enterobacteriaceae bacterium 4M9]|nr:hypothetical protein [Enterobacteriaceae bacterium 4M9]
MSSLSELEQMVNNLKNELETEVMFSRILLGSVIKCLNEMSANKNVYEAIEANINGMKPMLEGKSQSLDNALNEALRMIQNQQ